MNPPRHPESGFALLFVYAMAAAVAIMLYMALPRVAFEAQRDKEQLLIDRGEQYSRAVTLYVRKFNKYPADFDALQSTQNLRFLRHKYIDPMTGKDDWRIIHVGPGGVFTDSLVYGKKKDDKKQADQQNFITELQQTGGNQAATNPQAVNVGTRERPSDGGPPNPNNPNQSGLPPLPQFDANGQLIQTPPAPVAGTQPGQQPGIPGQPPQAANGFPGGLPPGVPVTPGQPFPGQQPGQPPNSAAGLINQILTTPRPGGLNGLGGVQQATVDQNGNPLPSANPGSTTGTLTGTTPAPAVPAAQIVGGGIAGVASKLEEDGIKIYKDQTSYNKWEFVYDITKDPSRTGQIPAAQGSQGAAGANTPGATTAVTPGAGSAAPVANTTSSFSSSPAPAPVTPP